MSNDKLKDGISEFHDHGIYVPNRTVEIFGEINLEMFDRVFKNLHALDSTQGTINLIINSEGGDVTHAKAIYDAVKGCVNYVRGIVYGEASSSASLIFQACDERLLTPNSYLMIHVGEEGTSGHPEQIKKWQKKHEKDSLWIEDVYLEKIKLKKKRFTRQQIKSMLVFDTILYPKDAVELGLADNISKALNESV